MTPKGLKWPGFDYPLNLHISQTHSRLIECPPMFDYPLNLHISQTARSISNKQRSLIILWIYISLKLANQRLRQIVRLIILWIYISLKRSQWRQRWRLVWLSFEFTYLSNIVRGEAWTAGVWLSFEFTYLSNTSACMNRSSTVWLSFEFTYLSNAIKGEIRPTSVWLSFEFTYLSNDSIRQSNSL